MSELIRESLHLYMGPPCSSGWQVGAGESCIILTVILEERTSNEQRAEIQGRARNLRAGHRRMTTRHESPAGTNLSQSEVRAAYKHCEQLARSHYENFTVGSWLLPRTLRPHLFAVYAFCRRTDDLGDEAPGDRLTLLNDWEAELFRCYGGQPTDPVMVALQDTIRRFDIPAEPFTRLIEANRMDQRQHRFSAYDDLLHYCRHSAEPVGRMVLSVLGYRDTERQALSDATCTALQLANFWQDVRRDYQMGRIYIPQEDMARFGYSEEELAAGVVNDHFRSLMRFQVDRAEVLFRRGLPLEQHLHGRARLDVALFSRGGMAVLAAIRRQNYDVLTRRPVVTRTRKLWLMLSTMARLAILRPASLAGRRS